MAGQGDRTGDSHTEDMQEPVGELLFAKRASSLRRKDWSGRAYDWSMAASHASEVYAKYLGTKEGDTMGRELEKWSTHIFY